MKVRFIRTFANPVFAASAGSELDLPAGEAKALEKAGAVVLLDDQAEPEAKGKNRKVKEVETTSHEPDTEKAVQ